MSRIDISDPLCEPAEFDGRIHRVGGVKAIFIGQALHRLGLHCMADQGNGRAFWPDPNLHGMSRTAISTFHGLAILGEPGFASRRCIDRAGHRRAVFDKRDVDSEVRVAAHERLGAVDGVNQKKLAANRVGGSKFAGVFLRDHMHPWEGRG